LAIQRYLELCGCRFKDYDGALLSEFVDMRKHTPDTLYNALLKENFTLTDILKVNRALNSFSDS